MEFEPHILYEDCWLTVCQKPVDYLSEPGGSKSLPDALSLWYRSRGQNDYIATVHRLDRVTGGVMVFSRRKEITGALAEAVAQREFHKEYLAVLRGVPEKDEDTLEDLLFRDSTKNKTYVVKRMRKGVREASLYYRLCGTAEKQNFSLVQILLHTGRTHQIRAQFSARGLPLVGDIRYGSKDPDCTASLWAWHLRFLHPKTGKTISCFCPPPNQYPWNLFSVSELREIP